MRWAPGREREHPGSRSCWIKWSICLIPRITKRSPSKPSLSRARAKRSNKWSSRRMGSTFYLALCPTSSRCWMPRSEQSSTVLQRILIRRVWGVSLVEEGRRSRGWVGRRLSRKWLWVACLKIFSALFCKLISRQTRNMYSPAPPTRRRTYSFGTSRQATRCPWCSFIHRRSCLWGAWSSRMCTAWWWRRARMSSYGSLAASFRIYDNLRGSDTPKFFN